ncbi:YjaG family protein [Marinobacterium litorale]|uniref:YjaG family protein n=1 Tax=Marinobacterium litorale TaxID=404770 RepID=UPI00041F2DD9|nr:YjaG family protein [Marinobacterium litorale]
MTEMQQLDKQLRDLTGWQLVAFSAALSERMFPNYQLFSRLVGFGDHKQLRSVLDGVWNQLAGKGARINPEVQLDNVEANIPDLDEYDMYGAMPAYDAAVALYSTLTCVSEGEVAEALEVANLSRECVANFIEVTEANDQMSDEELVRFINTHDLMLDEDAFREEVIARLLAQKQPSAAFIEALRTLSENEGVSNIGISGEED